MNPNNGIPMPDVEWDKVKDDRGGARPDSVLNMTLRDYFAGQAIAGIQSGEGSISYNLAAMIAYELADAMMRARDKEGSNSYWIAQASELNRQIEDRDAKIASLQEELKRKI